jgi:hypothetical protein
VRPCGRCERPFVSRHDQEYCTRPAPGLTTDCSTLSRNERFRTVNRGYRREYQRLEARHKRGRLPEKDWLAWKADNRPGEEGRDWQRFEDWKKAKEDT